MLRLKLEQANAKPDPPFVYDREPNFMTYQKWVLEVKDWLRHGYVWWKHCVSQLKKYLSGPHGVVRCIKHPNRKTCEEARP